MDALVKKFLYLLTGSTELPAFPSFPALPNLSGKRPLKYATERELIQMESEIGAELFGQTPPGHYRQFFNLDRETWIWYEEWIDEATKKTQSATIRYEVHPNGILKAQEGARYNFLEGEELNNFITAVGLYYERVMRDIYRRDPATGQKFNTYMDALTANA